MTGTLPQYVEIWNHMVEIAWVLRNPTPGTMLEDLIKYGEEAVMLAKETTSSGRIWPNMEEIYLPDTSKPTLLQRWCLRPGTPFFTWIMLVRMINGDEKVILSVWMAVIVVMRAMEAKYRHIEPQDLEGIFQEQKLLQGQVNLCEYDKFLPIVQHIKQGHCFRKDTRIHSENVPVQDGCWQWNKVDVWLRDFYGQLVWCLDMRPPVAAGVLSRNGRARNNLHFVHPYPRDAALIHTDNTFFDSEWVNKFDEGWHGTNFSFIRDWHTKAPPVEPIGKKPDKVKDPKKFLIDLGIPLDEQDRLMKESKQPAHTDPNTKKGQASGNERKK